MPRVSPLGVRTTSRSSAAAAASPLPLAPLLAGVPPASRRASIRSAASAATHASLYRKPRLRLGARGGWRAREAAAGDSARAAAASSASVALPSAQSSSE